MNVDKFNKDKAFANILENRIVTLDLLDFFIGDLKGLGSSRYVFTYMPNTQYVIKIDVGADNQNVREWDTWLSVAETKYAKWFAPCKEISECGRILIQKKCTLNISYDKFPKMIPAFFADLKYQNWGMLNGKLVCFDYALNLMKETGINAKMKKANWYNEKA